MFEPSFASISNLASFETFTAELVCAGDLKAAMLKPQQATPKLTESIYTSGMLSDFRLCWCGQGWPTMYLNSCLHALPEERLGGLDMHLLKFLPRGE